MTLNLYASSDGSVSDGTLLDTVTIPSLRLASLASKTEKLKFTYGPSLASGTYSLIAQVNATAYNSTPTQAASTSVVVCAPTVELTTVFAGGEQIKVNPGHNQNVVVTVTNDGNTTANGTIDLTLYESANYVLDASATTLTRITGHAIKLRAGRSMTIRLHFVAPAGSAGGSYDLIASTTSNTTPSDTNALSDTATIATV